MEWRVAGRGLRSQAGYTVGSQEVIGSHPAIPGEAETASHGVSLDHTALKALLGPLFLPFSPWRFLMDMVPFRSHCPCQTETVPILTSFISNRINSLYVYIAEIT